MCSLELFLFLIFIFIICYIYLKKKKFSGGFNILSNIDKIYLINLDISNDRLKEINNQNKNLNLNIIRHRAVYGKDIDEKNLIKKRVLDKNHKLNKGAMGCYLSHLGILKKAYRDKDNIIIVLEDDIIFNKDFKENLEKYYKEVPDDWDIIYLGGSRLRGKKISEHVVKGVYDIKTTSDYNMGTYAMMINKKGVKKLLKVLLPMKYPIDTSIAKNNKKFNIYFLNPSIINHNNNFKSEILYLDEKKIVNYNNNITNKELILLDGGRISNITNNIDKIYFINLDSSKDRLEYMNQQGKNNNLNLVRYPAVYGKDIDKESLIQRGILDNNHKLKDGELGCYLSHLGILKKAHRDKDNIIMVLEDDIIFNEDFKEKLNEYYKEVPNDWDIIYLGGSRLRGRKISEHVLKGVYDKEVNGNYNMGMYAVLLNKKSINKILKKVYPIRNAIDTIIAKNNDNLNIYFLNPSIINHNNDFISDIHYVNNNTIRRYNNKITNTQAIIVGEKNNSLFDIPLFYINLDIDVDRNKSMEKILRKFNLDGTRIEAINGKTYDRNYIVVNSKKYNFVINTKRKPNIGQLATCLSHIKAVINMKDRNIDYGFICEDDLDFNLLNRFKNIVNLENIINEAPNDWEMIKLHSSNPTILNKLELDFNNNKLYSKIKPLNIYNYSMMAYIINKKYIKSFFDKYYKNGIFVFDDNYFVSDVTLLFSEHIYNYTIPLFRSKTFSSSRLNKINKYDYESNKIINDFWNKLIEKN